MNPDQVDISTLPSIDFVERKNLPPLSAVYFIVNPRGIIKYIGSTINLKTRFKFHHRSKEFKKIPGLKIAWLSIPKPALLSQTADAYIDFFKPVLNSGYNTVPYLEVKIPLYQHEWLEEILDITNESKLSSHKLISIAIDLLRESNVDWSQVKNLKDLKQQLGIK